VLSIVSGGCTPVTDEDGNILHYKVKSYVHKKRPRREETWVIPEPAAKAIEVLERATENRRRKSGTKWLFQHTACYTNRVCVLKQARWDRNRANLYLREFVERANSEFSAGIPADQPIHPKRFRRTLARFIVREPFGVIAGKLQYKHAKAIIFQGYAGHDLREEVDEEAIDDAISRLLDIEKDAKEGMVAGPGLTSVLRAIDIARSSVEAKVDDGGRLIETALRSPAKRLNVGRLNYCFFDPAKALCLSDAEKADPAAGPRLTLCNPDNCANSIVTKAHLPLWKDMLADVRERLKAPKLNSIQRLALRAQETRILSLLERAERRAASADAD
jgi:hypothetical protein